MHGVPADLPIQRFVGDYLSQIRIGMDGIQFHFGRSGTIAVEGRWELFDGIGKMIDSACEHSQRDAYRVHALFNQDVTDSCVDPPRSFTMTFASGHRLTIFDGPQYESFSIHPGNIFV
jgi:hypothetical protein